MENISHHHLGSVLPNESDPDGTGLHGFFTRVVSKTNLSNFGENQDPDYDRRKVAVSDILSSYYYYSTI